MLDREIFSERKEQTPKKMGQIVKKKKKGRPSKADLAKLRNFAGNSSAPDREPRRSLRQRNVRYTFHFDDYLDDDELFEDFDEEEDVSRREKKLKFLVKLPSGSKENNTESTPSRTQRVSHAPTASQSSSENGKPSKKRKIDADEEGDEDEDENDDGEDDDVEEDEVLKNGKAEPKGVGSAPGTPNEPPSGLPLPDKKTLELILDKLQKKDIYGVYAEPADPEELPDYHDVIEHPMDFATVRSNLANGSYATLEQFEGDVFLICSNAMLYNAPDTIYYKQARSILELAKKKFGKIRSSIERTEEIKSDQKIRLNSVLKKPIKKPMGRTLQDPVGSDFSSGATLATAGDFQNGPSTANAGRSERAGSVDRLFEGSLVDNSTDKAEESLPGKRPLSRIERKPSLNDENRRATYNISAQPEARSESIFSTFEGESKQLVTVGLYVDHSYARSLARFAATLGPVAWKIASKRIEQALPSGSKFGRGWVGEYEPLPTPVLMLENCSLKEPDFFKKVEKPVDTRRENTPMDRVSLKDNSVAKPHPEKLSRTTFCSNERPPNAERKLPFTGPGVIRPTATSSTGFPVPAKEQPVRMPSLNDKASFFGSPGMRPTVSVGPSSQQPNSPARNFIEPEKVLKQVELNCAPTGTPSTADFVADRQILNGAEILSSRSMEMVPKNRNLLPCGSFRQQPNVNGVPVGGLPNGKLGNLDNNRMVASATDMAKAMAYFPYGQDQGVTDTVQLMRMFAEKAQNQQKLSNQSPVDNNPVLPSPVSRKEDPINAAAAAARAWMSVGAGGFKPAGENVVSQKSQISADSLYNPARDFQSQVSRFRGEPQAYGPGFQHEKSSFPLHPFVPQPSRIGADAQFQGQPIFSPQLVTADLSRFQMQSPWQSLSPQMQQRQKQESLPPDLNISFQSAGSPGRPASNVLVDSQQPDLALQL